MTLDEKLGQLSQLFWYKNVPDDRVKKGQLGSYLFVTDPHEINRLQHVAVEQSRLHIPLLIGFDVTQQMADFNRNGERFRVNAGETTAQASGPGVR